MNNNYTSLEKDKTSPTELGSKRELVLYSCDPSLIPAWTDEDVERLNIAVSRLREILKDN